MTHPTNGPAIGKIVSRALSGGVSLMLLAPGAWAADVAAGKAMAQARCATCHEPADWQGETAASLQSLMRDVTSGKIKHGKAKVELSDADIANIAAYWLSVKK
jgi:mono/diheme cytochrome c family protein